MTQPSWTNRRRFMIITIGFCMLNIGYVLYKELDTEAARTVVSMAFTVIGTTVASYVFGAAWQDIKLGGK